MSITQTQKELHDLCDRSEFVSQEQIINFKNRLEIEKNLHSLKFALEKFQLTECPKCRVSGAFKWHFLGKLSHPDCGRSWFVSPGSYIGAQLKAVFRTGGEIAGNAISDAEKKGESGFVGMIFGFLMGVMLRLPFAIMMIPIQALVSLCQSNKDDGEVKEQIKSQNELSTINVQPLDSATPLLTPDSISDSTPQTFSYTMTTFLVRCEMATDPKYPNEEYLKYLTPFGSIEFESPVEIWSVFAELAVPSKNRICNVYCYDKSIDDMDPDAPLPTPIGMLQLTLWQEKGPEIHVNFKEEKAGSSIESSTLNGNHVSTQTTEFKDRASNVRPTPSPSYGGKIAVAALIIALAIGTVIFMSSRNKPAMQVANVSSIVKDVTLRQGPGSKTPSIGKLAQGTSVVVIGSGTDSKGDLWNNVRIDSGPFRGQLGYVKPKYMNGGGVAQAATFTSAAPAAPVASNVLSPEFSRENVKNMLDSFINHSNSKNYLILDMYADRVNTFNGKSVDKSSIKKDEETYFNRWENIRFSLDDFNISDMTNATNRKKVVFRFNYQLENSQKIASGISQTTWILESQGGQLKIVDQKETIISKNANAAPAIQTTSSHTGGSDIESTIRGFYQAVQNKHVDDAINMFSAAKKPNIKVALIQGVATDTEYYAIDSINVTNNDGAHAETVVKLRHKKYKRSEENWEINVSLVNEDGGWKIVSTPGRKI